MLMTEIRKESVSDVVSDVRPALATLAESAKAVLGYDVLAKTMEKVTVQTETSCLRMVLQSLDMEILNERDVARYQKEQMIARTTELMQEWLKRTAETSLERFHEDGISLFSGPDWARMKISEYHQPIPEYVLAKAVQIKEKMPECELYVEHLSDHPDPFLIVAAGKARFSWEKPQEHYYVEVWAEPKFEGRLATGEAGTERIDDIPF